MPAFHRSIRALVLASAFWLPVPAAFAQANLESAKIPQPHLAKARAIAFGENGWKFPALITCYPDEGQSAEHVIKDPGPGKAADNFYFLGTGIVAAWAVNTSDGIILIDALDNQAEVDKLWDKLIGDGGQAVQCGWLKDKYGLSWQIVPHRLYELIRDKDTARAARVMAAMMQMVKIDVAALEKAAKG